jgi:phage terminase small subunit
MAGRRPKPTEYKQVIGVTRADRLNPSEPKPEGEARKPAFLKGRAAKIWAEYAPQLIRLRLLTEIDAHHFAAWCSLAAEFERDPQRMTASRIAQMRTLGSLFGLDPSSRARLSVKDQPTSDPASKYFAHEPFGSGSNLQQ